MDILNPNRKSHQYTYPYDFWVIDNFLKQEVINEIAAKWPDPEDSRWHKGHPTIEGNPNILEQGMRGISKLENMPGSISKIMDYFHSSEFLVDFEEIGDGLIPDKTMRWSGMRTMLPGSFQLIHSDARKCPTTNRRKEWTVLLYTQPNWEIGPLEIWDDNREKCTHKLLPKYNRAVVFKNSATSFHGVPEVNFERRALTFSIMSEEPAEEERHKAWFVARPEDPEEVNIEGRKRAFIGDRS